EHELGEVLSVDLAIRERSARDRDRKVQARHPGQRPLPAAERRRPHAGRGDARALVSHAVVAAPARTVLAAVSRASNPAPSAVREPGMSAFLNLTWPPPR